MIVYLDASAAAKLLVVEAESEALATWLGQLDDGDPVVSSALLETELRRIAVRLDVDQAAVTAVLGQLELVDVSRSLFHEAGLLPGAGLRSLDALHLATALQVGVDLLVGYDVRLLEAARGVGLVVGSPA